MIRRVTPGLTNGSPVNSIPVDSKTDLTALRIRVFALGIPVCAFKFEDICKGANGKPAIRLNFSKTDQFGAGKILPISQELFDLLEKWRTMISDEGYILRAINRNGHIGENLHPASVGTLLKGLQKHLKMDSDEQPLSGHSFRVGAALDLLEQGEPLEMIMLRGGWQTDSTAMKYLRSWSI